MKDLKKLFRIGIALFLIALLVHPVLTMAFIATHLGVVATMILIYVAIRLCIGMTLFDFLAKELEKEREEEDD